MDEPLSNLDAKLRVGMRASLAQLHERLGVTTVYVTHDQVEAMTLGQRVAVMRDGQILQVDAPQTLYHEPRTPLRRGVHRLAGDESRRGDDRGRRASLRPFRVPLDPGRPGRRRAAASSSASGPRLRGRRASRRRAAALDVESRSRGARRRRARLLPGRRAAVTAEALEAADEDRLLADERASSRPGSTPGRDAGRRGVAARGRPCAFPFLRRGDRGGACCATPAARGGRSPSWY